LERVQMHGNHPARKVFSTCCCPTISIFDIPISRCGMLSRRCSWNMRQTSSIAIHVAYQETCRCIDCRRFSKRLKMNVGKWKKLHRNERVQLQMNILMNAGNSFPRSWCNLLSLKVVKEFMQCKPCMRKGYWQPQ
jgi:hypothetical protein